MLATTTTMAVITTTTMGVVAVTTTTMRSQPPLGTLRYRILGQGLYGSAPPCLYRALLLEVKTEGLSVPRALFPTGFVSPYWHWQDGYVPDICSGPPLPLPAAVHEAFWDDVFPAVTTDPFAAQRCDEATAPGTGIVRCILAGRGIHDDEGGALRFSDCGGTTETEITNVFVPGSGLMAVLPTAWSAALYCP